MAAWPPNNQKKNSVALKENDTFMGALLSQKPGVELMQNCDLPPPVKVFSGSDKMVISSMNRLFGMMGPGDDNDCFDAFASDGGQDKKLELLKALRLSQTRAREAERKAASLVKERDSVSNALLQQSLQLHAHSQWVWLLELQLLKLQTQWKLRQEEDLCRCSCGRSKGKDCADGGGVSWLAALAFCLGIASVGLAFGCRYMF